MEVWGKGAAAGRPTVDRPRVRASEVRGSCRRYRRRKGWCHRCRHEQVWSKQAKAGS